ncbi:hypothetical protein DACRYDRAFT_22395 [Dacryopinax primogenitus]|uniref:Uncharacterized protein n=1 Tax=Dacryopinax primogenitus (strain DJM 731) TaxID=1858805 RepID=M5G1C2_DACPD|nr:uncharacterized protein DACRYDRAFT_22395 [Dacryopinax primogenitus]EJU01990.1 hypothetical protein DACRYDRAFT_22395 [Dacryopinax primogenitus]
MRERDVGSERRGKRVPVPKYSNPPYTISLYSLVVVLSNLVQSVVRTLTKLECAAQELIAREAEQSKGLESATWKVILEMEGPFPLRHRYTRIGCFFAFRDCVSGSTLLVHAKDLSGSRLFVGAKVVY